MNKEYEDSVWENNPFIDGLLEWMDSPRGQPVELIETHLIAWLEMEFTPKIYSQEQIDELDRLTETWVDDHYDQRLTALK